MKILHIATHFGTTTVYNDLFRNLKALGHSMTYIVSGRKHDYTELDGKYTQLIHLPLLRKFFSGLKSRDYGKFLIAKSFTTDCDVIHAHTALADGTLGLFIKNNINPGCRLLVTVRTTDLKYRYRLLFWERPVFKKVLNEADVISVLSPSYMQRLIKINPAWKDKIQVVPNALPTVDESQLVVNEVNEASDILFVGRIIPGKNIHGLILAYLRFRKQTSFQGNFYLVGGDGSGWYNKVVRYMAGFSNTIHLVGKVPKQEVFEYMKKCKLLVVPSFSESFGLVYIEGLLNKMVVIGSSGEGVSGYFTEAEGYFEVNPNSYKAIATGMAKAMKVSSRSEVDLSRFTWPKVAAAYTAIYSANSIA